MIIFFLGLKVHGVKVHGVTVHGGAWIPPTAISTGEHPLITVAKGWGPDMSPQRCSRRDCWDTMGDHSKKSSQSFQALLGLNMIPCRRQLQGSSLGFLCNQLLLVASVDQW